MLFRTLNKLKMSQLLCGVMLRALDLEKRSLFIAQLLPADIVW